MFFTSEKQLIKRAQQGSEKAWLSLCQQHQSRVFNQCLRLVGNSQDAADICQEVFVSVFRNLHSFNGSAKFSTWVFTITHARIVDHMRKHQLQSVTTDEPQAVSDGPSSGLQQQQSNAEIHNALKELPFEQRLIVELKFFQQYTFAEIANQLDLSINTVKARLYSALGKLKGQLEVDHHG